HPEEDTPMAKARPGRSKSVAPPRGRKTPAKAAAGPLARPATRCKFTLFDLLGRPRAYYLVEPADLPRPPAAARAASAHCVLVANRSGAAGDALAGVL